jgi:CRISPR/Cas system CSM-associated protein Csm3 (group 7 of RAMP superfamily)
MRPESRMWLTSSIHSAPYVTYSQLKGVARLSLENLLNLISALALI